MLNIMLRRNTRHQSAERVCSVESAILCERLLHSGEFANILCFLNSFRDIGFSISLSYVAQNIERPHIS